MRRWVTGTRFVVTLGLALLLSVAGAGQATTRAVQLDLEARPLAETLTLVAEAFELQIAFFPEDTQGIQAPALSGRFTADQAFTRLLEATTLEHRFVAEDSVAIRHRPDAARASPTPPAGTSDTEGSQPSSDAERPAETSPEDEANGGEREDQSDPAGGSEHGARTTARETAGRSFAGEIVVTAQKREQELRDVPLPIQAFQGEALDRIGIRGLEEVVTFVPGASEDVSYGAGQRTFQLRGVATGAGDPTVGYYLDDTAFFGVGQGLALMGRTFDIERIEVLRGPQGTLYGNGSMGGTVRYITRAPNLSTFEASLRAGASTTEGGDPGSHVDVAASVPIVPNTLGLRLVASTERVGGYTEIPEEGLENTNPADLSHARASLLWAPSERMVVRLQYAHSSAGQDGSLFLSSLDPPISAQAPADFLDWTYDLLSASFELDFDVATLTSTTSYIDGTWDLLYNIAVPPAPGGTLRFAYHTPTSTLNNETRLVSNGGGGVQWVAGVFYSDSEVERVTETNAPDLIPSSTSLVTSDLVSVFGELSWPLLGGRLIPLVGLRYFEDERAVTSTALETGLGPFTFDDLAPRLSLSYLPSRSTTLYLNVGKGFRSGSFNTPGVCDVLHAQVAGLPCELEVPSDELWSSELGVKQVLAEGRLFLDGALYYQDWRGNRQSVSYGGASAAYQVGDAVIPGVDLGLSYSPASARGLTLLVTGNWNDAHFTTLDPAIAQAVGAEEGDRLPAVPEWTASIVASYEKPVAGGWTGLATVGYSHVEPQVGMFGSSATGDSRDLLRARIGVDNGRLGVHLFGTNLLNETGAIHVEAPVDGLPTFTQDYPRQVGLEISYDF